MAQFNVNLAFNADTGKAKTQIMELQSLLSKIAYTGTTSGTDKLQTDLYAASEAAKELQFHLNNAFNASTGNFDLSMLDRSLKTSGSNITDLSTKLLSAGATGQQAFVKLAQSISLADQPMFRISKRMQEFAVTMKNTVKWQLSSSMLHGFMGAVQSAYGYAQDLNKSLNDIRIVTGYNTDKMAEFAEQANKAAKALSTTTTDYTNASLIYFQQGLSDEEVTARTDITVKMANAVGQSAEIISEQLTAVWNNFDDGSKSLEYYADVMTALGAATASSSDEISEGLSKFAAVAGSVGLSYEYATSALATLTSNTRESADVVGNSLKTLFARIQGLQLGETLDDGTDLNKYSQALEKVGISIYDANGGLKDMDNILDEMATKWNTLSDTQQVALAQTVAGVRQYNQLIALMENWNNGDSDSMIANLNTVAGSEGALQKQADIYAQGWEAAEERVQAAAEGIYQSLLDDKFFINLTNGFANLLGGLDAFIDGAGGVKTILVGISGIVVSMFANKIPQALDTLKYNLQFVTNSVNNIYKDIQDKMDSATKMAFEGFTASGEKVASIKEDSSLGYQIQAANELTAARSKLAVVSDKMSNSEKQYYDTQLNIIQSAQNEVIAIKKKNEALQESINLQKQNLQKSDTNVVTDKITRDSVQSIAQLRMSYEDEIAQMQESINYVENLIKNNKTPTVSQYEEYDTATEQIQNYQLLSSTIKDFHGVVQDAAIGMQNFHNSIGGDLLEQITGPNFDETSSKLIRFPNELLASFERLSSQIEGDKALDLTDKMNIDAVHQELKVLESSIDPAIRKASGLQNAFDRVFNSTDPQELQTAFKQLVQEIDNCEIQGKDFKKVLEGLYGKSIDLLIRDVEQLKKGEQEAAQQAGVLKKLLNEFNPQRVIRTSEALGALGGLAANSVSIITTLISAIKNIGNPELSGWERFSALISGIGMGIPQVLSLLQNVATLRAFSAQLIEKENAALTKQAILESLNSAAFSSSYKSRVKDIQALLLNLSAENKEKLAGVLATAVLENSENELNEERKEALITQIMSIAACDKDIAAKLLEASVNKTVEASLWGIAKARIAAMPTSVKIILAVVAALAALVAVLSALHTSQKEAKEAIENSKQAYEDEKNAVQELESELSNLRSQIAELESQGPLSLTQQADLNRMYAMETSLENQLALQKEQARIAAETHARTFQENWDEANYKAREFMPTGGDRHSVEDQSYTIADAGKKYGFLGVMSYLGNAMAGQPNVDSYYVGGSTEEDYDNWISKYGDDFNTFSSDYMDMVTAAQAEGSTFTIDPVALSEMQTYLKQGRMATVKGDEQEYFERYVAPASRGIDNMDIFNDITSENIRSYDFVSQLQDGTLDLYGISADDFNNYMKKAIGGALDKGFSASDLATLTPQELTTFLQNINDVTYSQFERSGLTLKEWVSNTTQAIEQGFDASAWKNKYNQINEILKDLNIGETISAEDYALLSEEYQQYFQVQADGTAMLVVKAEELRSAIENIEIPKLIEDIQKRTETMYNADSIMIHGSGTMRQGQSAEISLEDAHYNAERGTLGSEYAADYIKYINELLGINTITQEEAAAAYNDWIAGIADSQATLSSTATSVDQLDDYLGEALITQEQYNKALMSTAFKEAEALGIDKEELAEYAEFLEMQGLSEELAIKAALAEKEQSKGADDLIDNYKDYKKVLKEANLKPTIKDTESYIKTIKALKKDLSLLTGFSEEIFSEDFVNSDAVQQALEDISNGIDGATERLKALAAIEELKIQGKVELDEESLNQLYLDLAEINNQNIEIGAVINDAPALDTLADLLNSTNMTAAQMQEIFNNLGWEPEIVYEKVDAATASALRSQGYQQYATLNPDGGYTLHNVPLQGEQGMISDQQLYVPKIKSKNHGGGSYKKIDPPGNSSTKSPSSSGGGGSKTKKETKQRDDEVERYHVVKEQMEELEKQAEKLSKAKDQAFGKGKLDLIEKEIELLDEQIKKQDEYLQQIQKYGEEDKALMIVYGAEFDENGVITNYEQLMDQELARYNAAVNAYNKNHDEKKFAAAEARYEKFLSDMEQYEETMDEWDEAQVARADMIRKNYDLKFEALTYEIEVGIELEEDDLKLLDYYLEKLDDDAFSAAESITLLGKKTQDLLDQSKIYSDGITDLLSLHGLSDERINQYINGSLTEQELITIGFSDEDIATLREYRDNLLEVNKDLSNIREEIYAKIIDAFDAWNEKIIDSIDKIEKLNKVLNSYQNIIDIVGINTLKIDDKFMNNLSNAIVDNSKKVLDASVKKYKSLQNAQLQAQQQYEQSLIEGNEETIRYWEETLEHINNEVQNAEQDMMDSWQDALQAAADAFDKSIENIINSFEKALSGSFGNLDNLSEMFEQQTEISDRYLADYEKIYQLSKLNRDINNSIDDTDSIKAKRILKSLQEDINDLQNSEKEMSQYDLEYLQKKYELKLAEIALEEAQNAKSTVRLMQDSEGNWSYVYTNDQEKISDAQQGYEDALFDMQVTNEDYIQDLQEKALDAQKAMTEAIKSIDKTQFATEDAYKERIDQIREYYMDQQNYYYDEMAKALGNNKELYENDWLNYSNLTNYKISSDKEYVDNFAETTYAQIMGYSTIEEAQNNFIMATDIMVEEIIESYTLWLSNINEIMDLAGTSIDTFASDTENNLDRINTKTNEVADSIDDLSQEIVDDFDYIIDTVSDWEDNYVNAIDTTIQANEDMYDSCNSLIGMLNNVDISISNTGKNFSSTAQQIAKAAADIAAAAQRAADAASNIGSDNPGGYVPNPNPAPQKEITPIKVKLYHSPLGSFKMDTWVNQNTIEKLELKAKDTPYQYYLDQTGPDSDGYISEGDYKKLKKMMDSMDTGGYTGEWGPDGKIAMLHQKELVLNAEDTQNMLNAVNIVREIARVIDLNAGIQSLGLYLQNLSHLSSGIGNSGIQQSIQITAEFPDAVYHNEIEEAFKTLLNESSQYIGREK